MQANILPVVQEYVPLKRAGATYKGLCPFHNEKTPSFNVNPDKGFFHCFGCGVGGDVFKFLELHEKVGFPGRGEDAGAEVRRRPARAGDGDSDDARRDAALREALLKVHEVAAAYFKRAARRRRPARARAQQLADRGVTAADDRSARPRLRAATRATASSSALLKQGFSQGVLLQSGLDRAARQRRGRRSVPEPADGADLPRYRVGDRLRRPVRWTPTRAARST